ncbi:unnamed protein product [Eretmochelys imbricata]
MRTLQWRRRSPGPLLHGLIGTCGGGALESPSMTVGTEEADREPAGCWRSQEQDRALQWRRRSPGPLLHGLIGTCGGGALESPSMTVGTEEADREPAGCWRSQEQDSPV